MTRIDPNINFRWTLFSPDQEKINYDWYSVRWTGKLLASETGNFKIGLKGDDGYRLFINEKLIIDNWKKQTFRELTTSYFFEKDKTYDIKLEFYETVGNVRLQMIWNLGVEEPWQKEIKEAVAIASKSEVAIVVAGIEEGEFQDRAYLSLPGHQEEFEPDPRSAFLFKGGESEGLRRLEYYIRGKELIDDFKESRDGMLGEDYSTKLSPWLAQGCLSPKMAYYELRKHEEQYGRNKSTYEFFYYLMYRDFLRFMAKKYGNQIFFRTGPLNNGGPRWRNDWELLQQWIEGRTGIPFIDANMREIRRTGYMSSRGRQNVASFLAHELGVNWQMGAEYFESMLIDYDVASNWGNWNNIAGVGSDPREARNLNILSQAKAYDPKGDYVKRWLPELKSLPPEKVHQPGQLSCSEQKELHLKIGDDYPEAMVDMDKWSS